MPERNRHENHQVWLIISIVLDIISDDLTARRLDSSSKQETSQFEMLRALGAELADISLGQRPLISEYELDQLERALTEIIDSVRKWADKEGPLQLQEHIEFATSIVAKLPQSQLGELHKSVRGLTTKFEHERVARKELEAQVHTQTDELAMIRHNVADLDRIIKGEFKAIVDSTRNMLSEQQQRLDNTIDNIQQRITAAEKEAATTAKAAVMKHITSVESESAQHIAKLKEHEAQARDLLQVTGETATATDYGRHASDEKRIANKLRIGAAAFFAGSFSWVLLSAIFPTVAGSDMWVSLTVRAVGAIALIGGGLYLARESANHRRQEVLAKSKQLDLKAIDPFMANLPGELRNDIKSLAARRLFADTNGDDGHPGSGHPYEQLAQAVLNIASRTRGSQNDTGGEKS